MNTAKRNFDREAAQLYSLVFDEAPTQLVVERFAGASDLLNNAHSSAAVDQYYRILQRVNDLEALEVYCRYAKTLPLLVAKTKVIVYIAETRPENQRHLVAEQTGVGRTAWALVTGGFRTAHKLIKGWFLWMKVRHV